jgi:hypothetical protein
LDDAYLKSLQTLQEAIQLHLEMKEEGSFALLSHITQG